jgi:hypothetical protein
MGIRNDFEVVNRKASVIVENVDDFSDDEEFELAGDGLNGNDGIPNRIEIKRIVVAPTVSTIRRIRLFTKATRIADPSNPDFSLIYEDTWTDDSEASDAITFDSTHVPYINEDRTNRIYGTMRIQNGSPASDFRIDIYYE